MQYSECKVVLIGLFCIFLSGCSFFVSQATEDFGNNLTQVILNHNEPKTVADAVPSYLLLLETLIENEPDNEALLTSASSLYGVSTFKIKCYFQFHSYFFLK